MEIRNYTKTENEITYTISVGSISFDMKHVRTDYGSVQMPDTDDFLSEVAEMYNFQYADVIEEFIGFQTTLLLYGIPFEWHTSVE